MGRKAGVPVLVLMWLMMFAGYGSTQSGSGSEHIQTICSTWGNGHYKTFDGDVYQFPGTCEYNLASDCQESYLEFSVHIQRAEREDRPVISQVVVTIKNVVVVLRRKLASVNGDIVKTPYYGSGVLLEKNEVYTKLYAKLGLTVMWNGEDAIMLELDSKYRNRTCGLCGDYNGISMYNEFIYEGEALSPITFGNQQKIHRPNEVCEDPYEEESTPSCSQYRTPCEQLLKSNTWADCMSSVDPEPYLQACIQDMCSCNSTLGDFCVCSTLSEFSRQCSHAGGIPQNWRTEKFCAKQCPFNMVYLESGSPCMNTCSHTDTSTLCEEHRMDGCFCPAGTVFDDVSQTGCIPVEQCQCNMHGTHYQPGETVQQECEECVCESGKWACKSRSCPGSCAVEGGAHISTFDGKTYTFHGNCYYVLSKDCDGAKFSILGELIPCGSKDLDTCLKTVVVLLENDKNNALLFKADGKVLHNSAEISLPYNMAHLHVFRPSSFHIILQSDFGLQLQVQLVPIMQVYVSLEQSYKTKMCGLCGDFNDVQSDDFKTQLGLVEGTAAPFANSWKAQASCPDRSDRLDDPCALSVETENYAEHWCSVLETDRKFAECHALVNPKDYYKKCVYSTCNCEKSEDCLCAALSSYVRACAAKGVSLQDWRSTVCDTYIESCPDTQNFSYGLSGCQRTCLSLSSDLQYCSPTFLPVDGCTCPEGLYQDEGGICVPMDSCPCFHNGDQIQPGKSITTKDEQCMCTNGKLHCLSTETSTSCPSPKTYFNCSTARPGSTGLECQKTCKNLAMECYIVGCVSGCKCPDGLYDDGMENCVLEHQCPCFHNGEVFPPGVIVRDKCNTCTCKAGQWQCTKEKCPGTCTIYGSGHYITFDEQRFGFDGDCGYVAAQDMCGDKSANGTFSVITENIPCGTTGTTCSKSVRIYMGRTELKLSDGKYEVIELDWGEQVTYRVRSVGLYLVIETSIGLEVLWDRKTALYIILDPSYAGQVCGLCGNFDHNGKNDFTTKGQLVVASPLEFGNSWKVSSSCPDAALHDPCSMNPFRHGWAKLKCSIIKGETFEDCHPMVDPSPYYDACVRDSCACDSGGDCECFCTAVAAYAAACNKAGVCVAWRTPEICPVFCDFYNPPGEDCEWHYSPCHSPCIKTCENPEGNCSNSLLKLEGCYARCPPDKPLFDEETKTCVEKCGCYIDEILYRPGQDVPTAEKCTTCKCTQSGNTECERKTGCCFYNGNEYKEGESTSQDNEEGECVTHICRNGTITTFNCIITTTITSTTPTTTPTTITPATTTPHISTTPCERRCTWTSWFDTTDPEFTPDGDDLETYENIKSKGDNICDHPEDIKCRAVSYPEYTLEDVGQKVQCNVSFGLICKKEDNVNSIPPKCYNYEIQVRCCSNTCPPTTTPYPPSTTITTPPPPTTTPYTPSTTTPPHTTSTTTPSPPPFSHTPSTTRTSTPYLSSTSVTSPSPSTSHSTTFSVITGTHGKHSTDGQIKTGTTQKTPCPCILNGTHFNPGMNISIVRNTNGFCNYTVCSVACKIETKQEPCPFDCPTWNKTLNEVFWLSNCKKVICIGNDTIQPVPYECPPTTKISCSNGRTPVLVSDENTCCQHYECDCFCSGWGDPHYVTFDGLYYSFQGNCTYVLVQEIIPKYDQFKIYIDNVQCNLRDNVSCPRSIMVSYGTQKITLINKDVTGKVKLQVLVNDNVISLPFTGNGTEVYSAGINVVLQIPEINAVVTFGGIAFTINLPYRLFGNNTQGQCGTCNNNQTDDCMLPGGRLVKDCAVMGDHWVTNKSKPYCIPPVMPTSKPSGTTKPPCKPDSVCDIIRSKVFAECHKVLPPEPFYQGCVFDSCHMKNSSIECSSLQTYASMCAQLGACVSWRDATKGICPPTCPPNLVYKSCHRAKQLTCDDNPYEDQDIIPLITEGCFCPDGTTMYNKQTEICVKECGCMDPNRKARKFGETFEYNCQNCICDVNMKGVRCEPKDCPVKPKPDCSGPGFVTTSETSSTDPCCKELVCRCNASTCPPTQTDCPVGFKPTVVIPDGKCCPEYKCEKKGVCVYSNTEYQPGSSVPVDKCQLCSCTKDINLTTQLNIISCVPLPCNRTCEEGFQYVQSTTDCCGKCVQTHCVIKVDGTIHILQPGDNWSPPGDKCEQHNCEIITNTFVSIKTRIQCPPFNESKCQPETITTTEDGCCKTCVEKTCQLTTVKRSITQNGCKSPDVIEMTQCEGACSSYSMYSAEAASMQRKCSCCQEVKTHNRTIQLICPNGTTRPYTYIHVDECSCQIPQCRVP